MSLGLFYVLGGLILLCALMVVTLRNIFHSALFLVLAFFLVAGVYLMLDAEFIAAVQVLIYVGAVTILILFAIMLTNKLQTGMIRQVNEQVIPAVIIAALFLALSITSLVKTFGGHESSHANAARWTGSFEISKLPVDNFKWNWTIDIEDDNGQNYIAGGLFSVAEQLGRNKPIPAQDEMGKDGYILSSSPDFSTRDRVFEPDQTVYLKVWSEKIDPSSVSKAVWKISDYSNHEFSVELGQSNTEIIGRLLMSKFVLPFEIVSLLLLAALIGAIVIARKDA